MKHYWQGKEIILIPGQQFTSHWNCYYLQSTEDGNSKKITVAIRPDEVTTDNTKSKIVALKEKFSNDVEVNSIDINKSTYTALKNAFPSIGRTVARSIIRSRPKDGYEDFEQLKKINKDLSINWEEIKTKVVF
ncbi:MAG: hypothetical protein WBF90_33640 [Rivularia sp. (in: cyanobacteria)]